MDKSIRVRVLDREFGLRVREEAEHTTRDIATYVDARMRSFKRRHPDQPELTIAVVTALAIAEELYGCREQQGNAVETVDLIFEELDQQLAAAIASEAPTLPRKKK